ncbi:unnamed protein product [Closterium sp. NIES-64]|nr:unnamed protein product [Closterium sp. NIES-64]
MHRNTARHTPHGDGPPHRPKASPTTFTIPSPLCLCICACAAVQLASAVAGEAGAMEHGMSLFRAWTAAYGLADDPRSALPPSPLALPANVPPAPHLEDCAQASFYRFIAEDRSGGGGGGEGEGDTLGIVTDTLGIVTDTLGIVTDTVGIVTDTLGIVTDTLGIVTDTLGIVTDTVGIVTLQFLHPRLYSQRHSPPATALLDPSRAALHRATPHLSAPALLLLSPVSALPSVPLSALSLLCACCPTLLVPFLLCSERTTPPIALMPHPDHTAAPSSPSACPSLPSLPAVPPCRPSLPSLPAVPPCRPSLPSLPAVPPCRPSLPSLPAVPPCRPSLLPLPARLCPLVAAWHVPSPHGKCPHPMASALTPWHVPSPHGMCPHPMASALTPWHVPSPHGKCPHPMACPLTPWHVPSPHGMCPHPMACPLTPWHVPSPHGMCPHPMACPLTSPHGMSPHPMAWQVRGSDADSLAHTREAQRDIWTNQMPPRGCQDRRLLVAPWPDASRFSLARQVPLHSPPALRCLSTCPQVPLHLPSGASPPALSRGRLSNWKCGCGGGSLRPPALCLAACHTHHPRPSLLLTTRTLHAPHHNPIPIAPHPHRPPSPSPPIPIAPIPIAPIPIAPIPIAPIPIAPIPIASIPIAPIPIAPIPIAPIPIAPIPIAPIPIAPIPIAPIPIALIPIAPIPIAPIPIAPIPIAPIPIAPIPIAPIPIAPIPIALSCTEWRRCSPSPCSTTEPSCHFQEPSSQPTTRCAEPMGGMGSDGSVGDWGCFFFPIASPHCSADISAAMAASRMPPCQSDTSQFEQLATSADRVVCLDVSDVDQSSSAALSSVEARVTKIWGRPHLEQQAQREYLGEVPPTDDFRQQSSHLLLIHAAPSTPPVYPGNEATFARHNEGHRWWAPLVGTAGGHRWWAPLVGTAGGHRWWAPLVGTAGGHRWWAPLVGTAGGHRWWAPLVGTAGGHRWWAPLVGTAGGHRWWAPLVGTAGGHRWWAPLWWAPLVGTAGGHRWWAPLVGTAGGHRWWAPLVGTAGGHRWWAPLVGTAGGLLISNELSSCLPTMCTAGLAGTVHLCSLLTLAFVLAPLPPNSQATCTGGGHGVPCPFILPSPSPRPLPQLHWWRAQAVRFMLRWPSAHLCHVINQQRHTAYGMHVANHIASLPAIYASILQSVAATSAGPAAAQNLPLSAEASDLSTLDLIPGSNPDSQPRASSMGVGLEARVWGARGFDRCSERCRGVGMGEYGRVGGEPLFVVRPMVGVVMGGSGGTGVGGGGRGEEGRGGRGVLTSSGMGVGVHVMAASVLRLSDVDVRHMWVSWHAQVRHMWVSWHAQVRHMWVSWHAQVRHMWVSWHAQVRHMWVSWHAQLRHMWVSWHAQVRHMWVSWHAQVRHMWVSWHAQVRHMWVSWHAQVRHMWVSLHAQVRHMWVSWHAQVRHMWVSWHAQLPPPNTMHLPDWTLYMPSPSPPPTLPSSPSTPHHLLQQQAPPAPAAGTAALSSSPASESAAAAIGPAAPAAGAGSTVGGGESGGSEGAGGGSMDGAVEAGGDGWGDGERMARLVVAAQCDAFVGMHGDEWAELLDEMRCTGGRRQSRFVFINVP